MNEEDFISIPDRVALLQKLGSPTAPMPTDEARQALKILQSLQDYQPQKLRGQRIGIKNPVTRTMGSFIPTDQGNAVSFQDLDTKFDRTKGSKMDALGKQATVNQLINEIPTRPERKASSNRYVDSRYTFEPLQDQKDMRKQARTGKRTNQRASAYKRFTKGAFTAYPRYPNDRFDPDYVGYGERIGETTWQPRDAKRRFSKHVQFDTTDVVKQLGEIGARRAVMRGLARDLGPVAEGAMLADEFLEVLLGTAPSEMFKNYIDKQFAEGKIPTPMTLIKP